MATDSIAAQHKGWALPGWLRGLAALALLAGGLALLGFGLGRTGSRVTIEIDGRSTVVRTHVATVGDVLRQAGLVVYPEDRVSPALDAPVPAGRAIQVDRARLFTIHADGQVRSIRSHAASVGRLLSEAGIGVGPGDELWLAADRACPIPGERCGAAVTLGTPLPGAQDGPTAGHHGGLRLKPEAAAPEPPALTIRRAARLTLNDQGKQSTVYSTATTVGQVLHEQGVSLFAADLVVPALQAPVAPNMTVVISRSVPVQIRVDGYLLRTRTQAKTVAGVLGQEGVALIGKDTVAPALDAPVAPGITVRVTRVREMLEVEFDPIPYTTIWVADPELELDQRRLAQEGQIGITKRRYRIVYHDGQEVERTLEDAWTEQEPVTKTLAYGTKIVIRTLDTPDGPIEYWRKMRVYTVSYTAASSGKDKTHPRYGYTRLGIKATKGVVAVDPTVIPLRTRMYVPGYGRAIAADTGGGVKGKLVDLCFDVGAYQSWHWWADVYLLTPVPPRSQIRWLLPDWPKFPDRRR